MINSAVKGLQTLIKSEFFEKSQDFTEMPETNQMILLPTIDHPKDDLYKKPDTIVVYRFIENMVSTFDSNMNMVTYSKSEDEVIKIV